jgi:hypothetical protein
MLGAGSGASDGLEWPMSWEQLRIRWRHLAAPLTRLGGRLVTVR